MTLLPRSPVTSPPHTVLLIEDHRDSREIYSTLLRHCGFRVLEAMDGNEGVRMAQQHKPDTIVMDLGLPDLDGWKATEILKGNPETAHIPVVAVSVYSQPFYRARTEMVGCDAFLAKPCEPTRLVEAIQRVLAK